MAVGPEGTPLAAPPAAEPELPADLLDFLRGLEGIIDRALRSHPRGEVFVYGIHQGLDARVTDALVRRYLRAGWSEARVKPVLTGAQTLILVP